MSRRPARSRAAAVAALALAACHGEYDPPDPGLRVLGGPLAVTEAGGAATFTVSLAIAPQGDVDVDVLSGDAAEGLVAPAGAAPAAWATLRFGPADWDAPRTVTVVGVDDARRDGDVEWAVRVLVSPASPDAAYAGAPGASVAVVTRDDDTPALRLSRATVLTAETGAVADAFEVSLASRPSGVVTVPVSSGDPSEGLVSGGPHAIAPAEWIDLVFTPSSWDAPQAVTVTGVDDDFADGGQVYAVTVGPPSGDPDYAALPPQDVTAVNADTDVAGVLVATDPIVVSEGWPSGLHLRLASRPAQPVHVPVVSGDPGEVSLSLSEWASEGAPSLTLTFEPDGWNVAQWVYALGVVDYAVDGDQTTALAIGPPAGDPAFASAPQRTIAVTVVDRDLPADVVLEPPARSIREGYGTGFWVSLSTRPSDAVRLRIASPDPAEARVSCATAESSDPTSVTVRFDSASWSYQWVEVLAVDDAVASGDVVVAIPIDPPQSADARFAALPARVFPLTVVDDEVPAILASHAGLALVEGGSAAVAIALAKAPAVDVVVPVASSDPAEALLSVGGSPPASEVALTFTPETWSAPQQVTVVGVDDASLEPDPAHPFTIAIGPAVADGPYGGVTAPALQGTTTDDEAFPDEGTLAAPVEVGGAVPWPGTVGVGSSWYRVTGLPDGGLVTVSPTSPRVTVSVLEDAPAHATICAPALAMPFTCPVRLPPGGAVIVQVDGGFTPRGATFTLDAAPFTSSGVLDLPILEGDPVGARIDLALSGVPPDYWAAAIFVDIAHPRANDLQIFLVPPPGTAAYEMSGCSSGDGADWDHTVFYGDAAYPRVCGGAPPFAGIFCPATYMPHPYGSSVNGTWTLVVRDPVPGNEGTLVRWGIAAR